MEGKLIKVENGYVLMVDNTMYATDNDKLSLKNCEAIVNGYDLDELAVLSTKDETTIVGNQKMAQGFIKGFRKALEILGNKNKKIEEFIRECATNCDCDEDAHRYNTPGRQCDAGKLLQKTEWDVEIVMETCSMNPYDLECSEIVERLKLDSGGYLILKRK
jgi:hypothetical protein